MRYWTDVWSLLQKDWGWSHRNGNALVTYFYCTPSGKAKKKKELKLGIDYFATQEDVVAHLISSASTRAVLLGISDELDVAVLRAEARSYSPSVLANVTDLLKTTGGTLQVDGRDNCGVDVARDKNPEGWEAGTATKLAGCVFVEYMGGDTETFDDGDEDECFHQQWTQKYFRYHQHRGAEEEQRGEEQQDEEEQYKE